MMDESFHKFLTNRSIVWQFNLSKASWSGGQFERLMGLTNQVMYKILGNANLKRKELKEVMFEAKITLSNRHLGYI